jgi:hypothetical protein
MPQVRLSRFGGDPPGAPFFKGSQTSCRQAPSQNATVVDDGTRLASFADGSLDFVIANHMLEHFEDPIAALEHGELNHTSSIRLADRHGLVVEDGAYFELAAERFDVAL